MFTRILHAALALVVTFSAAAPAQAAMPISSRSAPPACSQQQAVLPGSTVKHQMESGGRERNYRVHVPDGYDAAQAWPLIVVFHGRGNTAEATQGFSGLDELPALVAYADGVVGTGGGDRQAWEGAPYSAPGVDDIAFTAGLLDQVAADYCVDTTRVYATGKSNGAGFTGILACEMADRFAAIAPVAAANYAVGHPECNPSRPVPVLAFHGSADATIPYHGDETRGLPDIPQWTAAWAARNGCHHTTRPVSLAEDVTEQRWVGCPKDSEVRLVTILGGGHTWPGADAYSGGGYTTQNVEASELMWNFFRHHRLPR
ncbi:alpha/beta hydrolase family esterase [Micrococcus luteus]|uniref:alpha/beta hydrolase family esterase n=1 Tax=Micrococcus luteus TaxID=1270 RepID=UPI0015D77463|nr:PHB depolymerase family esterase [Micrococcus luteus]